MTEIPRPIDDEPLEKRRAELNESIIITRGVGHFRIPAEDCDEQLFEAITSPDLGYFLTPEESEKQRTELNEYILAHIHEMGLFVPHR